MHCDFCDTRVFIHFDPALHAVYAPQNSSRGGIHRETKTEPHKVPQLTDLRHFETDEETLWSQPRSCTRTPAMYLHGVAVSAGILLIVTGVVQRAINKSMQKGG
jgi:hypothetical protein